MNAVLPRFLKSAYRREPLPSFLVTVGIVDALIGSLDGRWILLILGLGTIGIALSLRWLLLSQRRPTAAEPVVQRYLPPASTNQVLPSLSASKRTPPPKGARS